MSRYDCFHGRHTELRAGVFTFELFRIRRGDLEGVSGRNIGVSGSALRMNCKAVNGEPFGEDVDFNERGLPVGEDMEKDGSRGSFGSGVRLRASGSSSKISAASRRVVELIHFSSRAADPWGGESKSRKLSAKWPRMNLGHACELMSNIHGGYALRKFHPAATNTDHDRL